MTEIKKKKHKYVSMEKEYKNNLVLQVIFIMCIIILSAIFIYSSNSMFNTIYDDSTYKDLDSLGSQYNTLVRNNLDSQLSILEYNSKEIEENIEDEATLMNRLKNIQDTTSFSYVSLLSVDGNVIDSNGDKYVYKPDYLDEIIDDNENIIGPLKRSDNNKDFVLLAYPIKEKGSVTKILQGIFYLEDRTNILPSDDNLIYGFVIDVNGNILYGSNNEARMSKVNNIYDFYQDKDFEFGDDLTFKEFLKKVANKESFAYKIYYKGEVRYCHATPSKIQDWYTLSASAKAEGLNGLNETSAKLNQYVFWFVLAIAFVLIIAFAIFRKQRNQVENIAYKDRLTGISTFTKFRKDAEELLANNKGDYRLIAMDICAFKYLNEAYGFDKGNEILKGFVDSVKPYLNSDDLFCRSNADVFLVLTKSNTSKLSIEELDEILSNVVYKVIGNELRLSSSVGVYHIIDNDVDITQIVDFANYARKKAKDNKSYKVLIYDENYKKTLQLKREITINMDRALKNKEFIPYIQPKVSLTTGNIIGGEILVRWIDHNGVKHEPNDFIEVFEKNGFIVKLDLYMLEETCKVLKNLYNHLGNSKLKLSFNISRVSLFNNSFIDDMIEICKQYDVKPSDIEIELTETVLSDESNHIMLAMEELKSAGFKLSIDDFGSKYSSLNILRTLPVDTIKIDKAFLYSDMLSDKALQIVESIIYLAKKLKLEIVVEGIENEIQYCQLKQLNCDVGQGFYFSKAITLDEFKQLIEKSFLTPISNDVSSVMLSINKKLASKFIDNNKMECDYYDTLEFPAIIIKVLADNKDIVHDAIISFANKNLLKYFDYELEDLLGKSLSTFTGPLNSKWKAIFSKAAFEGERSKLIEYVDLFTQEFDIYAFQHNHGFVTCFLNNLGINSDSNSPHELLSNIQGGIITFKSNEQGLLKEVLYVGDGWENLMGYNQQDMIVNQINFFDLIHPDDRTKVYSSYANSIISDSNWYLAYRIMKKNSKYIWVSDRGCVVSKSNEFVTIQCIFNDITKIKLNEIKLDKAYKLNHDLINNIQGGLLRYKLNINTREAKIIYISDMWTQITGYDKESVEHKLKSSPKQLLAEDFINDTFDKIIEAVKNNKSFVIEYKMFTYDNEERWIRDKGIVIDIKDDDIVEIQSVILDITSHKSFEKKMNINNARLINVIQATKSCLIEFEPINLDNKYIINSFSVIGLGSDDDIIIKDSTGGYNINENIYHPEDRQDIYYHLAQLSNKLSVSFKVRVLNFKTNEYKLCDVTYNLMKIYGESRIIVTIKLEE